MASRYQNIQTKKTEDGKLIYSQTYYPIFGELDDDVYIMTTVTDRLDLIAYDFWGDSNLWWVVAIVNDLECDSFYPPIGTQLRVPKNIVDVLNTFNQDNEI